MSLGGILAVDIIQGSFDAECFTAFIDGLLSVMNPFPQPNSVLVLDNVAFHHHPEVEALAHER